MMRACRVLFLLATSWMQSRAAGEAFALDAEELKPVHGPHSRAAQLHAQRKHAHTSGEALGLSFTYSLCGKKVFQNLGGLGPDQGPQELRFYGVGQMGVTTVDLVVTNITALESLNATKNGKVLGEDGCFGRINVMRNFAVSLLFSFVYQPQPGIYVPIPGNDFSFQFTIFDMEIGAKSGFQEHVIAYTAPSSYSAGSLVQATTVDGSLLFSPQERGNGSNNPSEFTGLTANDQSRSVRFSYSGTSSFTLGFWTQKLVGLNASLGGEVGARNYFFGGSDALGTTTTTTVPASDISCGTCVIWGDPHVISFDLHAKRQTMHPRREAFFRTRGWKDDQVTVVEAGTFWLVKHNLVQIQGRYEHSPGSPNVTALTEIAVGGPFLQNNVLVVRPTSGNTTWNGRRILAPDLLPGAFANDLISAFYHDGVELVKDGTHGRGIEISLPMGVELTVNRWNSSMACAIKMRPLSGGMSGQCGNFNGDASDDENFVQTRHGMRARSSEWLERSEKRGFLTRRKE